jgi:hypothetical protein
MMMNRRYAFALAIAFSSATTLAFAAGGPTADPKTYVGCLTKASAGTYSLTNILGSAAAHTASEIRVESSHVDLARHVGEKVSVRGTEAAAGGTTTLTVGSITKLAKSCR